MMVMGSVDVEMFDVYLWWLRKSRVYLERKCIRLQWKRIEMRSKYRMIELDKEWREKDD